MAEERISREHRMGLSEKWTCSPPWPGRARGGSGWTHPCARVHPSGCATCWILNQSLQEHFLCSLTSTFFLLTPPFPPASLLAVYPFPGSSLTPHSSSRPDSHSGSSFHLLLLVPQHCTSLHSPAFPSSTFFSRDSASLIIVHFTFPQS